MFTMKSLFRKVEKRDLNMPKNLTKAQARQVQEIIERAKRDDGIPRTAQQSIPFQRMFPDGICRVSDRYYTKTKYITFGIEAESMREAKPRMDHVQTNLMNNFKRLGVVAKVLNGKDRLQLMHAMFHMGDHDRFYFDWNWLAGSGH